MAWAVNTLGNFWVFITSSVNETSEMLDTEIWKKRDDDGVGAMELQSSMSTGSWG